MKKMSGFFAQIMISKLLVILKLKLGGKNEEKNNK